MTRKRFIKLAMSEGVDKRVATFAANYIVQNIDYYKSYQNAYRNIWYGAVRGRFEMYVYKKKYQL